MSDRLKLFVYGSLKLGECNAELISSWVIQALPASLEGQMYLRPDGYPALVLKRYGRLGSSRFDDDLAAQEIEATPFPGAIQGQLLVLREGRQRLKELDLFEGFFPDGESEYLRVLVGVKTRQGGEAAWTYTYPGRTVPPDWRAIECWPPPGQDKTPDPYRYSPR